MSPHARWEELAVGQALAALEPEDEHAFLAHLAGCDPCRRTLTGTRELAGRLAYAAEPATPPPGLRRRLAAATGGSDPAAPRRGGGITPPRAGRRRAPLAWAVVAAVLAALLVAVGTLGVRDQRDFARADAARLRQLASVLAAADTRRVDLVGSAGPGRAVVYLRDGRAWLVAEGLDRNDVRTSVYVLWWRDAAGALREIAPFDVVAGGTNVIGPLPLPVPAPDVAGVAVSREAGRRPPALPAATILSGPPAG